MPTRVEELTAQFEAANQDAIQTIKGLSDTAWKATTPDDGRTVGVLAHHIATGDIPISSLCGAIANGQPLQPITPEMIDQSNAQHAKQYASVSKEETLALLEQNGATALACLRGLSDAQLGNKAEFFGREWTAEQAIQMILIGHIQDHLGKIRATA
jgi:hypothetical protein